MDSERRSPLISVKNLGFRRGERWLFRNLDLDLKAGEFLALVGPSGVGKSTLLSCLCGFLSPTEGEINIHLPQQKATSPHDLRRHFGIIFQDLQLITNANLLTNVLCGRLARFNSLRTLFGFPHAQKMEAYHLLCELGVGTDPYKWISQMSGGEQQRVAIARSLFQQPHLYFADEPVSSLDSYYAGRVLGLLRQEALKPDRAIVCVLHNAEHIKRFADIALSLSPSDPTAHRIRHIRPQQEDITTQ